MITVQRNRSGWGVMLAAGWVLAAALAFPGASSAQSTDICPVPDPVACLLECRADKARCWGACRAEKNQCIERARLDARVCKLDCIEDETVENVGVCRRRCVTAALRTAVAECDLGQPVCIRECHPYSCARECGVEEETIPGSTVGETSDCELPVDRACLADCADDFRACMSPVRQEARECLAGCGDLTGEERFACYADCASAAREGASACRGDFRECASGCVSDDIPRPDPACAGECRSDLGGCLEDAVRSGRACAAECSALEGEERRICLARCASGAKEAAGLCGSDFRTCIENCRPPAATE